MKKLFETFLNKAPLFPVTVAFIAGIVFGSVIDMSLWIAAIFVILASISALLKKYLFAAWIITFLLGGLNISGFVPEPNYSIYEDANLFYRAKILSVYDNDNSQSANIEIYEVGVDSVSTAECGRISARITLPTFETELLDGYGIDFYAQFKAPKSEFDLPDEKTPVDYLKRQNIFLVAFVDPEAVASIYPLNDIISQAKIFRSKLTTLLYRTSLSPSAKEFLNTTLLGDISDLSADSRKIFSASGLSHVLALSGLHVGIIAILIALFLWPIRFFGCRKTIMGVTIILLWMYVLITGFSPSVMRAVIMTSLFLIGLIIQRRYSSINSLMAAALIILLFNPKMIFTIGFQLSFAAVLSIIMFYGKITSINRRHTIAYYITSYMELSISAMMGTAIVTAYYFHTIPVYFIIANLAVAVLLPFIVGGGLMIIILASMGFNPSILCDIVSGLHHIMYFVANTVAEFPMSTINGIYFPLWGIVFYVIALISLYVWMLKRTLVYGIIFGVSILTTVSVAFFRPVQDREAKVYVSREAYRTNLVIDNCSDSLYILTTTPQEQISVTERANYLFSDYMGKRNIKGLKVIDSDTLKRAGFYVKDNCLQFGNKNIVIVSRKVPNIVRKANYMLVCRGYGGDLVTLTTHFKPDTVILSCDLHHKRALRYEMECSDLNIPIINLSESKWSLDYSH